MSSATQSCKMNKIKFAILLLLLSFSLTGFAQEKKEIDFGSSLSFELQKDITRQITLTAEEEVRIITNNNHGFERSTTTFGADYSIIPKQLKIGFDYGFMYRYNSDYYYEVRHRPSVLLSYKQSFGDYTISWRGRFQGTFRDESRGEYKINPKYVVRNKIDIEYTIFGSPWTPYISADLSYTTNDPMGNELYRIRWQGGTTWRINRTDYMKFFLRYDQNLSLKDPDIISLGVGYQIKL